MRKFDPWPVFFRREWSRNWPFLVGFAITGAVIVKFTASLTEEDAKNSPFVQEHNRGSGLDMMQQQIHEHSVITLTENSQVVYSRSNKLIR